MSLSPACPNHRRSPARAGIAVLVALLFALASDTATACNIPVFRYALERWASDELQAQLIVHDSQLSDSDRQTIEELKQCADTTANLAVTLWDLDTNVELPEFLTELPPESRSEPWCLIRSSGGAEPPKTVWSSPLRDVTAREILASPARETLAKMLLQGDSAVWLVLHRDDDTQAAGVVEQLTATLRKLEDDTPLPDGIGLPGSELYSEVPLMVSFPILEVNADDPAERVFLQHLRAFLPRSREPAAEPLSTLIVPVFGRGRALVALTADDVDPATVDDLTTFLRGACSCQVKRMNPGFDLLLNVDWKQRLFGDNPVDIPADAPLSGQDAAIPTLVAIAPGNVVDSIPPLVVVPDNVDHAAAVEHTAPSSAGHGRATAVSNASIRTFLWLTGAFVGVVIVSTLLSAGRRSV